MEIKSRDNWIIGIVDDGIIRDKKQLQSQYMWYMLNRTQSLFKYENLPNTIPQKDLELLLQVNGFAIITKVNDNLYALYGGLGGEPNPYYLPTIATVANPALKYSANLVIDEDCVVISNDATKESLIPMYRKYSALLAETDITLRFNSINARVETLLMADNDNTRKSAELFLKQIEDGKQIGVIASNQFFEGIQATPYGGTGTTIKDTIELQQYLKASWFNELGLNANYNMKREAINDAEAGMNDDILLPLIDDMLRQRQLGIEKVNAMFGTNITVDFDSSWKRNIEEMDIMLDNMEQESEEPEEPEEQPEDNPEEEDDNKDKETN